MKNLFLIALIALGFVACSNDDDELSVNDFTGKWCISELEYDGKYESADVDLLLSYVEFKSDKTYEAYNYYDNSTEKGTFSLNGDDIVVTIGDESTMVTVVEMHKDWAIVQMEEDGEKFNAKLIKTNNEPLLFLEPVLDFGATTEQVKAKEKRELQREKDGNLAYYGSNKIEKYAGYIFEKGKLNAAGITLSGMTDVKQLEAFLSARYQKIGQIDTDKFGWKNDNVSVWLSVNAYDYTILYMENEK